LRRFAHVGRSYRRSPGPAAEISIEDGSADEVVTFGGVRVAPAGAHAFNPAFDITPGRLITALVTETGVFEVSDGHTPG
jgi:methylthioribose-1-phosphate isomerase